MVWGAPRKVRQTPSPAPLWHGAVQCARSAPYVSVILKFALKGKFSVSTQDSKKKSALLGLDF